MWSLQHPKAPHDVKSKLILFLPAFTAKVFARSEATVLRIWRGIKITDGTVPIIGNPDLVRVGLQLLDAEVVGIGEQVVGVSVNFDDMVRFVADRPGRIVILFRGNQ